MENQHHIFTVSTESNGGSFYLFSAITAHIIIVLLATASIHKFNWLWFCYRHLFKTTNKKPTYTASIWQFNCVQKQNIKTVSSLTSNNKIAAIMSIVE